MNGTFYKESREMPDSIRADGQDWANHIARYCSCSAQIQAVLEFEERLDIENMKRAVRLSVDAEPVLGCIFVEDQEEAYWRRLEDIDDIEWCQVGETEDSTSSLREFITSTLEPKLHQLQVKIIRTEKCDILCIKLNHACCDGVGVKEYLHMLADIYTYLCENKYYLPEVNSSDRGEVVNIFKILGITDPRMAFNTRIASLKPTWVFPYHDVKPEKLNIAIRKLGKDQFETVSAYARENDATINDMILTAFYRAMFDLVSPELLEPMEICVSVDLRRYLPQKAAGSICNLSGVVNARVDRVENELFGATLRRVSSVMKDLKNSKPGLHSAASMELLRKMKYKDADAALRKMREKTVGSRKSSPLLSNIGIISEYTLKFGNNAVQDAYIVTPAMYSPGFMLGASMYNSMLTLCVSYYGPSIHIEDIEKFMDMIHIELTSL